MPATLHSRAQRYHAAFPNTDLETIEAHLAVVNSGTALDRAVTRHLGTYFEINPARYSLMRALYFSPEKRLPQNKIAQEMGTSPPNVTQLLDALERDGLVERVINAENRRVTYARLTAKGEAMCAEMVPDMVRFMDETMDGLSKQEKQQLTGLLIRLRHNFDRYLSSDA